MSHNITRRVSGNLEDFHQLTGVGEWPILKMSNIILRYFETVVRYCWTIYDVHKCAYCRLVCLWIYIYTLSRQPLGWDDDFFSPKTMDSTEESSATLVLAHAKIGDSGPGFWRNGWSWTGFWRIQKKTKNLMRSLYSPRTGFTGCWRGDLLLPSGYWTACEVENCPFTSMIYDDSPIQNCDCP